ncbi:MULTISPECIES: alpha/beta fold hydrolase [unclassified Paenibacillus]|uniref:alpha/beta fold hydrolase n=1 Tax=unclassified Paenibacillus TaxID=185978 RepID=UPI001AE71166|nr:MULTISPECIES: alpha/beta fold hydrolase [unclassified Paenibacillus]MBP1155619.1 alpha-beta hydrolase superfamily lysophospholipase [Paenibacillus sp. PvP091]MBP1168995.1 alpha-beta hydrolase superfamily lysophospholipase [Paenibacillus sp. PvR098]MBP2440023.1 alpha-beta hydrolase superfamily lysophospholipase [Paenibacillus sp. PvP052]
MSIHIDNHLFDSSVQQLTLYCRTWIPIHAKALLIFLHGAGQHSGHYSHVGTECLKRRIALAAPDLRGFGRSGGKRGHIHRFQDYLDDLDELVTRLQSQYSGLPIYLFGHSLGGLIAVRYVQHFADKIAGVLLSSPALGIHFPPFIIKKCIEFFSLVTPSLPIDLIKWNESLRKLQWFHSSFPNWTSEFIHDQMPAIQYTPRWCTEMVHNGAMALSEVQKFHFPVLFLYDVYDPVINADVITQFIETIPSKDKQSIVFQDREHQPLQGYRKEEALEHIFQWLVLRM